MALWLASVLEAVEPEDGLLITQEIKKSQATCIIFLPCFLTSAPLLFSRLYYMGAV